MTPKRPRRSSRYLLLATMGIGLLVTGCGQQYVLLHPAGPVAKSELGLIYLTGALMIVMILLVWILLAIVLVRFRDRPGNKAPYRPLWDHSRKLELFWVGLSLVVVIVISIPTVQKTYALDKLPKAKDPVVIDVTAIQYKWLFEYPQQHIATVNYINIPSGVPVEFELTADAPMNTFWVPRLGGMEYTMPNRVLPLWLEADKPGVYWGHSGQFSGLEFEKMFFDVKAVSPAAFNKWLTQTHRTAPAMTMQDYHALLKFNTVGYQTYGNYPADTFPSVMSGYTLNGSGMYLIEHDQHGLKYVPMSSN